MSKLVCRLSVLSTIVVLTLLSASAQEQPRTLTLNAPIERELAGGKTDNYTLNLTARQIAEVVVEQRGIDVVVVVISPEGKKLYEVDSPNGRQGDEIATIAATQNGAYQLEIRALDSGSPKGKYLIRLARFVTESEFTTARLAALGRLWGAIKYFHPYLAYREIDWDGALIRVIPQVKAARTPDEYRQAVSNLLQVLNDPATTIDSPPAEGIGTAAAANVKKDRSYFRLVEGYVVVSALDWAKARVSGDNSAFMRQPQMMEEIGKAKGIVLDCRYAGTSMSELPPFYLGSYLENALPSFVEGTVPLGTERYRVHSGYPPQQGNTSGDYSSSLVTQLPRAIKGRAQSKKPLAIITDEKTPNLITLLSGLQATGAKIVHVGRSDSSFGVKSHSIRMPSGLTIKMRITEFVHPRGGSAFKPDIQLPVDTASEEKVISAAIASLNSPTGETAPATQDSSPTFAMQSLNDAPYPEMSFPSEEYRLLALFRFWNVINYFFPYKHLIDKPWDTVMTDFIPRFLENKSALDYEMTVAEMVARIQDTHGFVNGLRNLNEHLGAFVPPIILRNVAGKLTIVSLPAEAAAQDAALKVGDVILAVDGEPTERRIAYLLKFRALSTKQSAYRFDYPSMLRGSKDSKVKLQVEGTDGRRRETELTRILPMARVLFAARQTPIYQLLPSGYGYIDLARLPLADAHKALDALINAPAIILDMRGYPNGTAWEIAPRLTEKKNVTGALFRRPIQSATNFDDEDSEGGDPPDYAFGQKLPTAKGSIYKGKVVMLINEDAISQAEHTCMFVEAATDVTFIGGPTSGANGDVTNLVLPGGIYVNFSGHDVRHADGRQLQRLGIQPHIKIEPTIKGIREGRDEVLEAAVKFLSSTVKK